MADNFSVLFNAKLNTKTLQESVDQSVKNLKLGNLQKKIDSLGFQQVGKKIEKEYSATGEKLLKITQTFVDEANRKLKTITVGTVDEKLGMFQNQGTIKFLKSYEDALIKTTKSQDSFGRSITTTIDTSRNLKTIVTEYTNSQGELVKETKQIDLSTRQLKSNLKEVTKDLTTETKETKDLTQAENKAKQSTDELSQSQNGLSNNAKKVGQSFTDVVKKVSKFYMASLPIRIVQTAITETTRTVKEFDDAFTEMAKVSDSSGEALEKYTMKLADLGTEVGRTRTTMTELATGFLKAGYTEEESAQLAKYGALLQNTADEQLEASEATSVLVSALKAFDNQGVSAIQVLDDINIVSADFAVSSADISRGLTQAGASMSTYGNSLEQTIGLITAGENFLPVTD